jgi:hypothetical protein
MAALSAGRFPRRLMIDSKAAITKPKRKIARRGKATTQPQPSSSARLDSVFNLLPKPRQALRWLPQSPPRLGWPYQAAGVGYSPQGVPLVD